MSFIDSYFITHTVTQYGEQRQFKEVNAVKVAAHATLAVVAVLALAVFWPFRVVPTGYRGVVTQFGEIKQVEMEKAKKWDGKLPQNIYASAPIPFINAGK